MYCVGTVKTFEFGGVVYDTGNAAVTIAGIGGAVNEPLESHPGCYTERKVNGSMTVTLPIRGGVSIGALKTAKDVSVKAVSANGNTYVLKGAVVTGDIEADLTEGTFEVTMMGAMQELPA